MAIPFGRYAGLSPLFVILDDPGYAMWALREEPDSNQFRRMQRDLIHTIKCFDDKPLTYRCEGKGCAAKADRCVFCAPSIDPSWTCAACDPTQDRVAMSMMRLHRVRTYAEACTYALQTNVKDSTVKVLNLLAVAKRLA